MTPSEIACIYDGFSKKKQMEFLARLAHEITISMRGCYSTTPQIVNSDVGSVVGRLNEIQHWILGHLRDVLIENPGRASGQDIIDGIFSWAEPAHFEAHMRWMLEQTTSRTIGRT